MILDELNHAEIYATLHPLFPVAFAFLRRTDLAVLPAGRIELDGNRLYANVDVREGKGKEGARLEAHRRYLDIQYVVSGDEWIGRQDVALCAGTGEGYSVEKDIEFFTAVPPLWFPVLPGNFAVFFPHDAHAPLAGTGIVKKVVVKVAVE
jgi:YhcH/YjgK/YiaL family protein